ncbi:mannose-6-phosphate isomerase, class I [Lactobacillus sp. PV037]|uniref:mannose-6-phosphate isomerase, class I n=1 Tax=unclassified Lactobacillus TaxID=2620435 RepID=UPI00223E9F22|nr:MULTISPECIES: mannose-6-phosphate isomerase, class I [unclassified Lactobacillus]QNQ82511.1 mannose-6-phosphate isomerase, class I [Lactobacillus sp. PV012]QNQ83373.1 mannose-6-phosphate isomerase, class I [Lactobacillus sp. PV037]
MREPIFLTPAFRQKIWGGRKLKTELNYNIPEGSVGEAWVISAYKDNSSVVSSGKYKGVTLRKLYQDHPELFGNPEDKEFPLLVKFLDANDNLSVQVHPDDEYARIHENDSGKTESWYVLHAEPGAQLIYGHNAKNKEELKKMIDSGEWEELFHYVPVKTGDFFYVPAGTVHALTKGIMVIETQQSSDVTYRLYDWDRVDEKTGKKRKLHIDKSLDTIKVPFENPNIAPVVKNIKDAKITILAKPPLSPHFYLWQIDINGKFDWSLDQHPYLLVSVIQGEGKFISDDKEYQIKLGTNFIIPNGLKKFTFIGKNLRLVVSAPVDDGTSKKEKN